MKPIKLVICGWGPYLEKTEIDFTNLTKKGIFLITGPTGAGKTTIFDAITYALYGNMSGEMREKGSVRSDFAKAETPTYVELFMSHGKEQYRIVRNPEYLRPKKRKSGKVEFTKEKENAVLTLPDKTVLEGNNEVNRKLQEILILDYKQFKQITMIAQGEFARLLVASPAEKARIFREIFGTSIYEQLTVSLRERAGKLYKQVSEYRHKLEEDIHLFSPQTKEWEELMDSSIYQYDKIGDYLKKQEEEYKNKLALLKGKIVLKEEKYLQCNTKVLEIKQINQIYEQLRDNQQKKQQLEEKRSAMKALADEIAQAVSAERVNIVEAVWKREEKALLNQVMHKEELKKEKKKISYLQQQLFPFYEKREALKKSIEQIKRLEEKRKEEKELELLYQLKQDEFIHLKEQYLVVEQFTQEKKRQYEWAERIYKQAVIGIVAKLVQAGEPCPVCGSLEHPHIAPLSKEVPEEEKIEKLRLEFEESNQRKLEVYGITVLKKNEIEQLEKQQLEIRKEVVELEEYQEECQKEPDLSSLLKILWDEGNTLEEKLEEYKALQVRNAEKTIEIQRLKGQLREQIALTRKKKQEFFMSLVKHGFQDYEEYKRCIRSEEFVEHGKLECKLFEERLTSIQELLTHLKESVAGQKEQDVSPLMEQLEILKSEKEIDLEQQTLCNIQLSEVTKIRKSFTEKRKSMETMEKEYGIVQDLSQLAGGNNSKRLVFEQYVLAGYFEEILRAANLRFSKMSGGRYELFRAKEVSDGRTKDNLEMIIMDYYTGKTRSVKTLSGGESFKAALSLALGMSDVIQANSGGIRVEALFIDEGFGALDSESLEQACQTLTSLVEKDKIIGIISHVAELGERIDNQIIIEKSHYGSTLRVI